MTELVEGFGAETQLGPSGNFANTDNLADGGSVLVWLELAGANHTEVQVLDGDGLPVGPAYIISEAIGYSDVVALASGGFVVAYTTNSDIRVLMFDVDGQPTAGPMVLGSIDGSSQLQFDIASLADGGFIASWQEDGVVTVRSFDDAGATVTTFVPDLGIGGRAPQIVQLENGNIAFTWIEDDSVTPYSGGYPDGYQVSTQIFTADGTAVTSALIVSQDPGGSHASPEIAPLTGGGYVVVWNHNDSSDDSAGIYAQIYDASGAGVGDSFKVSDLDPGWQSDPDVAAMPWGGFFVVWQDSSTPNPEDNHSGIRAQLFDDLGTPVGRVIQANAQFNGDERSPSLLVHSDTVVQLFYSVSGYGDPAGMLTYSLALPVVGTHGDDIMVGLAEVDRLAGLDGDDTISGGAGDDALDGGPGNDTLDGGDGDDTIHGGDGDDVISGGYGINFLDGGAGIDELSYAGSIYSVQVSLAEAGEQYGGNSLDTIANFENLTGGDVYDELTGNDGDNIIDGGAGGGLLFGLGGNDTLLGGDDDDILNGGAGDDILNGGAGNDTASFASSTPGVTVDLNIAGPQDTGQGVDTLIGIENLTGTDFADILIGDAGNNILTGGFGADFLEGGDGDDILIGGGDFSTVSYATASVGVTVDLNTTDPQITGQGTDTIYNSFNITGSDHDDVLIGNGGYNTIDGGPGADMMFGGGSQDIYYVDTQGDLVFEDPGLPGEDTIISTVGFYLYENVEILRLADGAGDIFGVSNEGGAVIYGNEGDNLLIGKGSQDVLMGGEGNDSLFGGDSSDGLFGDEGVDYLVGGSGDDNMFGGDGADALYGEDGNDRLFGGASFDTDILVGGEGNDELFGNSGANEYDLMDGGSGDDVYYVDTGDDLTFEGADEGTDTVFADVSNVPNAGVYLYANVENLVLVGTTAFGVGNELNNQLTGSDSANWLLGGAGNDTINGKGGNDVLFGEAGLDTFVFEQGSGGDVIGDFTIGEDQMDLSDFEFASFEALSAGFSQVGGDGAIDLGNGDFIVLHGVTMADLDAGDFIL